MRRVVILFLFIFISVFARSQELTFSRIIDFYPLNGELGYEIYPVEDGYLLFVLHTCIVYSSVNDCRSVIKLDNKGNIQWMTELDMESGWFGSLVETEQAYYIGGIGRDADSRALLTKLDIKGDLIWQKKLDDVYLNTGLRSMLLVDDQEIVTSGVQDRPDLGVNRWHPYLMFVDLEGSLIDTIFFNKDFRLTWTYQVVRTTENKYLVPFIYCPFSFNCLDHRPGGLVSIDRDNGVEWRTVWEDGWLPYISAVEQTDSNYITFIYQTRDYSLPLNIQAPPTLFYMDLDGNVLDSLVLWSNHLNQVMHTQGFWQDGIVACGQQYLNAASSNKGPYFGWILRVNEDREVLWQRSYTDTTYQGEHGEFSHIKQTDDGGFVLIGSITNRMTDVLETHVWLMKVDSNGCLTPGCDSINIITTTEPVAFPSGLVLTLYPNPATAEFHLELPPEVPDQDLLVSLLSSSGQVLRQQPYLHPGIRFDTGGLAPGMYYMTVHRKGSLVGVEKLVISH
jgi:hypothetical protein